MGNSSLHSGVSVSGVGDALNSNWLLDGIGVFVPPRQAPSAPLHMQRYTEGSHIHRAVVQRCPAKKYLRTWETITVADLGDPLASRELVQDTHVFCERPGEAECVYRAHGVFLGSAPLL